MYKSPFFSVEDVDLLLKRYGIRVTAGASTKPFLSLLQAFDMDLKLKPETINNPPLFPDKDVLQSKKDELSVLISYGVLAKDAKKMLIDNSVVNPNEG